MTLKRQLSSQLPQWLAAISANIGGFCMGTSLAWSAPVQEFILDGGYGFPVTSSDYSLISGMMPLGATVGSLVSGPASERIGRRMYILITVIPCILGWLLVIFSQNVVMPMIGRFIIGFCIGGFSCTCTVYTVEIAQKEIRGTLGSIYEFQVSTGILFSYVVGAFTSLTVFSSICIILPASLGITMFFQPESPYYHLLRKDKKSAEKSMRRLRSPHYDFSAEIDDFELLIEEKSQLNLREALSKKSSKKAFIVVVIMMLFQQATGNNAVVFFTTSIFADAGSTLDPDLCTIIVGIMSFVGTSLSTQLIERLGRKSLLIWSPLFQCIFLFLLGLYFYLKVNSPELVVNSFMQNLPIVSTCLYMFSFAIGYGPVCWMYIGEILPSEIKGFASGITCFVSWLGAFTVSFSYPLINDALKPDYIYAPFWVFAFLSGAGVIFAITMIVETKGKSLVEIKEKLETDDYCTWRLCA